MYKSDYKWNLERKCCEVTKIYSWIIWKLNQRSVNSWIFLLLLSMSDSKITVLILKGRIRLQMAVKPNGFLLHALRARLDLVNCFIWWISTLEISPRKRIPLQTNQRKKKTVVVNSNSRKCFFFDRL